MQGFLLRCAFLPKVTARAAVQVTGNEEAGRILALLHRHNYFMQKHPGSEPAYAFHDLFREFLTSRAIDTFSPEETRRVRLAAARQTEQGGQFEEAVTLYREAEDVEGLARVIVTQAAELLAQGRNQTLLEWFGHLPPGAVEAAPWLLCWRGFALLPMNPPGSRAILEKAFHAFRAAGDAAGVFLSWSGAVESILFEMRGNFGDVDPWIGMMESLLEEYGGFPTVEIEGRVTGSMVKALFAHRSATADVDAWIRRATAIVRNADAAPSLRIEAIFSVALLNLLRGELDEVETTLSALKAFFGTQEVPSLLRINAIWMETAVAIMRAEFDRCLDLAGDGLTLAQLSGIHLLDGMLLGNAAHAHLLQGNLEAARGLLRKMAPVLPMSGPWVEDFHQFLWACEALARGDIASAREHATRCVAVRSEDASESESRVFKALLLGLVAHERGEREESAGHVARASRYAVQSGSRLSIAQHALVAAYLSLADDGHAPDREALAGHLRVAREAGTFTSYVCRRGLLERLAAAALDAGVEVDYAKELIRRNRLKPGPHADLERWPWPVRIYTLGRFEVHHDGGPLEFARKAPRRPLLLLKTLIALGGAAAEEQLTDILWPDAEGDLAHQAFVAALHRLRQLLGSNEALLLKEGKLTLSREACWVDAWALERCVANAEERSLGGDGGDHGALRLAGALALYRGPFLDGDSDGALLSSARDRYRHALLRAAEALGKAHEAAGRWEEAILCYRRAVGAAGLSEHLVRRLVKCCNKVGREAEAAAARLAYEKALKGAPEP